MISTFILSGYEKYDLVAADPTLYFFNLVEPVSVREKLAIKDTYDDTDDDDSEYVIYSNCIFMCCIYSSLLKITFILDHRNDDKRPTKSKRRVRTYLSFSNISLYHSC